MLVPPIEAVEMRLFFFLHLPMLKRLMIHGSYVYSHLETLAASGFQENLKNFEQHLSNLGLSDILIYRFTTVSLFLVSGPRSTF